MRKNKGTKYFDDIEETVLVCSRCFKVNCRHNASKVEIDAKVLPIVQKFNQNGFETMYCCSGHMLSGEKINTLYIKFKNPLPNNFIVTKNMVIDDNRTVLRPKNTSDMSYKGYTGTLLELAEIAEINKKG